MQNYIPQSKVANNMGQIPQTQPVPVQYAPAPQIPASSPIGPNPNYAGVNIQIINPMVNTPNGYIYPQQTASAYSSGTQGGCYPSGYYTGQYGTYPQYTYGLPNGMNQVNTQNGSYPQNTVPQAAVTGNQSLDNTAGKDLNSITQAQDNVDGKQTNDKTSTAQNSDNKTSSQSANNLNNSSTEASQSSSSANADNSTDKKTEKRKVVELTDDYIKTLENYLNSQDLEVRKMGAHEVVNRLTEDPSRNDDPALTALVNKMLQDPSVAIRAIALSLLESRTVLGDDYTVNVLKKMQNSKEGFGQDAIQATNVLLKMAGKTVEKDVEVQDNNKKETK